MRESGGLVSSGPELGSVAIQFPEDDLFEVGPPVGSGNADKANLAGGINSNAAATKVLETRFGQERHLPCLIPGGRQLRQRKSAVSRNLCDVYVPGGIEF